MLSRPHVLVVTQNRAVANTLLSALLPQGFELSVVTTFTAAKQRLQAHPDLVIADVKLGAYNGIHLAVRAQAVDVPALVIGPDDPVLLRDATAMGASYLSETADESAVASEVTRLLGPARSAWMPAAATWTSPLEQPVATSWWVGDARGSTLH